MPIENNDWVIISLPFCGNGAEPPFLQKVLNELTNSPEAFPPLILHILLIRLLHLKFMNGHLLTLRLMNI